MAYWWASQGDNWKDVIDDGTLWAGIAPDGRSPTSWAVLQDMAVGDTVLHYGDQAIRAVSRVTDAWVPAARPAIGYPKRKPTDPDHGRLVRVLATHRGLNLPSHRAVQLVHHGSPGPIDATGRPGRRFLSPLLPGEGEALLRELGIAQTAESLFGLPVADEDAAATDSHALARVRTEQRDLRRHLLAGRAQAPCALCGRTLPEQLLIAAHIAPRRDLTDAERRRYDEIAMLACALGCDALFEWGHIVVDASGLIVAGIAAATGDLAPAVQALVGRTCTAHGPATEAMFEQRRRTEAR